MPKDATVVWHDGGIAGIVEPRAYGARSPEGGPTLTKSAAPRATLTKSVAGGRPTLTKSGTAGNIDFVNVVAVASPT